MKTIKIASVSLIILSLFIGAISAVNSVAQNDAKIRTVAVAEVKEAITPVTEKYMRRVLSEAKNRNIDTVVFVLDTPGGLLEATRGIVQLILNADSDGIDTVVYVSPFGARAGSAGVFITISAKYAAMAPGCNIGAAHPVSISGNTDNKEESIGDILKRLLAEQTNRADNKDDSQEHLAKKIEQDTVAFIKAIAELRGRNKEWAELAVVESVSITTDDALAKNVIDFIAVDIDSLMEQIYGEDTVVSYVNIEKSWGENLLTVLANPNLAYLLFILGLTGIGVEIRTPGLIFPGTLGALCFILGLYATQVLPINYAGLFLMALAFVMFIMEFSITSYGLLTLGGILSLVIGSAMLFDTNLPFMRVSVGVIAGVVIPLVALLALALVFLFPALRKRAVSGQEGMVGLVGQAVSDFSDGKGQIRVHGEVWSAVSKSESVSKDDELVVVSVEGLKLFVEKKK